MISILFTNKCIFFVNNCSAKIIYRGQSFCVAESNHCATKILPPKNLKNKNTCFGSIYAGRYSKHLMGTKPVLRGFCWKLFVSPICSEFRKQITSGTRKQIYQLLEIVPQSYSSLRAMDVLSLLFRTHVLVCKQIAFLCVFPDLCFTCLLILSLLK